MCSAGPRRWNRIPCQSDTAQGNPDREQMVLGIETKDRFAVHLHRAASSLEGIRRNGACTEDTLGDDRLESNDCPSQLANKIEIGC
jgi:hypothetical protein